MCIEYTGSAIRALSMEGRMTLCNMSIEAGARAGMVAPDETPFAYIKGRPLAPKGALFDQAVAAWRQLKPIRMRDTMPSWNCGPRTIAPQVTLGHQSRDGDRSGSERAGPSNDAADETSARPPKRALEYMGLTAGHADHATSRSTRCSSGPAPIHGSKTSASPRTFAKGKKVASDRAGDGGARLRSRQTAGGTRRARHAFSTKPGFEWREAGCSMCLAMNADVLAAGRALRLDQQPEFRRAPGSRRTHPSGVAGHGRRGRGRGTFCRYSDTGESERTLMEAFTTLTGLVAPLDRVNVDTDQIIPKQFLKTIKRTGLTRRVVLRLAEAKGRLARIRRSF